MKLKLFFMLFVIVGFLQYIFAYPPAVGIVGKAKNCLSCHVSNGPWKDDDNTIIDILDKESKESLKQLDGSFIINVKRGEKKTVLTVIGRSKKNIETPYRNAWLYVDPETIKSSSLSKFAPGWDVNLPMACRIVGDKLDPFENATITVLPMTLEPTDDARDAELQLQIMLTKGESVKGKPKEGIISNYFERKVRLMVLD
jgi:hypothetical protein